MICHDCPDLPNGTRKRPVCCKRQGAALKIGDRVPAPRYMPAIRPTAPLDNRPTFQPVRHSRRRRK